MAELEIRYTTEEVADRYHVGIRTVNRWVREGKMSCVNLGGKRFGPYVFRPSDLESFERRGEIRRPLLNVV